MAEKKPKGRREGNSGQAGEMRNKEGGTEKHVRKGRGCKRERRQGQVDDGPALCTCCFAALL